MNKLTAILCHLTILAQFGCIGQNLTKFEKMEVSKAVITLLKDNYVLQDSVKYISPKLLKLNKSDEINSEQTPQEFASYLTMMLREITHDAHFVFLYNPQLSGLLSNPENGNREVLNQQLNSLGGGREVPSSKVNYFFKKAEILEGNIGYLKLEQMSMLEESKATLDAAMAFLSDSDAFILDLRGNRGGAGGFIPYLMSYFFPEEKILLYRREMPAPAWDSISYHYTYKNLPGKRLDKIPVYVLTDQVTGSAATNLAYTMQSFGRAIVVGENTGSGYRGAHSASVFPLPNGFIGLIPIGKVVNAKTNTNWRNEGVIPDVKIQSSKALEKAYHLGLEGLIEKETNEAWKAQLESIYQQKKNAPQELKTSGIQEDFGKYVGNYEGGRSIWVENNELKYQRQGGSPLLLKSVRKHLYKITLPSGRLPNQPLPSVKFNFGTDGNVENITLVFDDNKNTQGPFKKITN